MSKNYLYFTLILLFHLVILKELRFTAWPEMVSFPYLINNGLITYKDTIHAYPPLLVNALAVLFRIFDYNVWVLKAFGWTTFLFSDLLIFILVKKLTKNIKLSLLAILVYVILQPILDGNMVWPDLLMTPFLLAGLLFLIDKKYLWCGIAFGLAALTKQTGLIYIVYCISYIVFFEKSIKKIIKFIVGGLVIAIPFFISLFIQKSFLDFINWTLIYPSKYWTKFPGYVQLTPTLRESLILLILFLPLGYLILKAKKSIFADKYFILLFGFLIVGIIGVYPRFSFFHLQPAIAFLMILFVYLLHQSNNVKYYFILLIPIMILILNFRSLQFGGNRFWEKSDMILAKTIQNDTPINKPIYLLGLDSNLYALANRLPNTPWLDNFGWYLEIPNVQETVIKSFDTNPPSAIFWVDPLDGNWFDLGVYQPQKIKDWIKRNYTKKVEIQKGIWEWRQK